MSKVRLWDLHPAYSGCTPSMLARMLLMPLQLYADESGVGDEPAYVMAGWISSPENWLNFSMEWQSALLSDKKIASFKMSEAMSLTGNFAGFTAPERDSKLAQIAAIIARYHMLGMAVAVRHSDWREFMKGRLLPDFDDPYIFLFYAIKSMAESATRSLGMIDTIDLIFDRQLKKEAVILAGKSPFETLGINTGSNERFPNPPIFRNDEDALPLQAADFLAWHVRRSLRDNTTPFDAAKTGDAIKGRYAGTKLFDDAFLRDFSNDVLRHSVFTTGMFPKHANAVVEKHAMELFTLENYMAILRSDADIIDLESLLASELKRFRLQYNCPALGSPHLHRKSDNSCLPETQAGEQWFQTLILRTE